MQLDYLECKLPPSDLLIMVIKAGRTNFHDDQIKTFTYFHDTYPCISVTAIIWTMNTPSIGQISYISNILTRTFEC